MVGAEDRVEVLVPGRGCGGHAQSGAQFLVSGPLIAARCGQFDPIAGAAGFQPSNPPPLLLAPLCCALELWADAGAERITAKARRMTSFMQSLLERSEGLGPEVVEVVTPQPPYRGAQLSIRLLQTQGLGDERIDGGGGTVASGATLEGVHKWLGQRGVVCDLRRPDMLRFAPAPLYNTYEEVFAFVGLLSSALRQA